MRVAFLWIAVLCMACGTDEPEKKTCSMDEHCGSAEWCDSGTCQALCPDDQMTNLNAPALGVSFWIDTYEASAHPTRAGAACSYSNTEPLTGVTFDQAAEACRRSNKRLCAKDEWLSACVSIGANHPFPYGTSYSSGACNEGSSTGELALSGSFTSCQTIQGVYDLLGNACEWISDGQQAGGSAVDMRMRCNDLSVSSSPSQLAGFRCCADANIYAE